MLIKIANAPCPWGVLEFELECKTAGHAHVLGEMTEVNSAGTELGDWGFMPTDSASKIHELKPCGLSLRGAFVPVILKDPLAQQTGVEAAVSTARLLTGAERQTPFIILADNPTRSPNEPSMPDVSVRSSA